MRSRAAYFFTVSSSAVLLLGCEGPQPLEPIVPDELSVRGTRIVSDMAAPSGATAVGPLENRIDLEWSDNSTKETGFEVHRSATGESGAFALLATTAARATRYSDHGVALGTQYCYKVRAVRVAGGKSTYSAFSNSACTTAPPNTPSNFVAVAAPHTYINLSWQDNSSTETKFQIYRKLGGLDSFQPLATTAANTVTYSDSPYYPGQQECYQVEAVLKHTHADGSVTYSASARSNTSCATTPAPLPPSAASNRDARPSSSFAAAVTWTDNSTNEAGFRIYRSTDGGGLWALAGTAPRIDWGVPSFEDTGRQAERQVCYRVVAFNAGGEASVSNADCITPPAGPSGLTATRTNAETVMLKWNDNSALEDGYQVWQHWSYGDCNGSAGVYEGTTLIAELGAGSTEFSFTPDEFACGPDGPGSYFAYYVVATKDGGQSSQSEEVVLP